jgi:competence protein ComEA
LKILENFSRKFGLTTTEFNITLVLLIVFAVGLIYKNFFKQDESIEYVEYDYSAQDSLFARSEINDSTLLAEELKDKNVDSKQEVLDFNARNFKESKTKVLPAEKSINLNTAGIKELTQLPGIGEKTAESILELRKKKGKFTKLNDLLDVKGIGDSKFSNIKKYIYID